jgi:phospholipase D1/2
LTCHPPIFSYCPFWCKIIVTTTGDDPNFIIKNQIGAAIVERIVRAYESQEKFKVFVLIPLMPAFPAELSTKEAATAR